MVSAVRQESIDQAFNRFVRDDGNSIEAKLLKGVYASHLHPKVIEGEISKDEALCAFLCNFRDRDDNGRIHREDWNAYWAGISAKLSDDAHFCQLMAQTFNL